jgi:phage-related protein
MSFFGTFEHGYFCIIKIKIVFLHDFVEKSQKTPPPDLALAIN